MSGTYENGDLLYCSHILQSTFGKSSGQPGQRLCNHKDKGIPSLNQMFLSEESVDKREDMVKIQKFQDVHPS